MEKRLGRGLGSLLGGGGATSQRPSPPAATEEATAKAQPEAPPSEVPISRLQPNAQQPRKVFAPEHLADLQASIGQHGILQPIVVRQVDDGFEIISGERRWRAAQAAGLLRVPITLRDASDDEMLELALIENVQRQDLDAIEKAQGYRDLMQRLDLTQDQVATRVGLKRATIANHLRLLDLPDSVQQGIAQGLITMGHARALLALGSKGEILKAFQKVVRDELSVRATEQLARGGAPQSSSASKARPKDRASWCQDLEQKIQASHGLRAQFKDSEDGKYQGTLTLRYHDRGELDRLVALLTPPDEL